MQGNLTLIRPTNNHIDLIKKEILPFKIITIIIFTHENYLVFCIVLNSTLIKVTTQIFTYFCKYLSTTKTVKNELSFKLLPKKINQLKVVL